MTYAKKISTPALLLLAVIACSLFRIVHVSVTKNEWYQYKIKAAERMAAAEAVLKERSQQLKLSIDIKADPNQTGLIGPAESPIVTEAGVLEAKRMVTNPNFAVVVVDLFKKIGLRHGDTIAVGYTGSLVGANIAVLSAAEVMGLKPIVMTSLGASSYGATHPEFTWLDMEHYLYEKRVISFCSKLVSLGGSYDIAKDLKPKGRNLLLQAIKRNETAFIYEPNMTKNVSRRMNLYKRFSASPIKAYINVGGGHASLGMSSMNDEFIPTGILSQSQLEALHYRGVISQMSLDGVPVINLLKVKELVLEYELPLTPVPLPQPGKGAFALREGINVRTALLALMVLLGILLAIAEIDIFILPKLKADRDRQLK